MQQRREQIRDYIIAHETATIEELRSFFPDKSAMTIRRDLDTLQEQGIVIRTYGGARINPAYARSEPFYEIREIEDSQEKEIVAQKAIHLVFGLKSLYLDAGSTAMALARRLSGMHELSLITNSVNIAHEVLTKPRPPQVTVIGGVASPRNLASTGSISLKQIESMNIDTAIMGASGFTLENGFTNGNANESELKRLVISKAHKVIMIMNSSKIGRSMLYTFARPEDIDILVTDKPLPPDMLRVFEEAGVSVY